MNTYKFATINLDGSLNDVEVLVKNVVGLTRLMFTGKTDIYRKDIYEGDMVQFTVTGVDTHLEVLEGTVKWHDELCCFFVEIDGDLDTEQKRQWEMNQPMKIIGRTWE